MMSQFRNFLWGIVMAFGELLPGVGMQTVAIIVGLYDDLIAFLYEGTEFLGAVGQYILGKIKKGEVFLLFKNVRWKFGLPLFGGLAITILALSRVVGPLFDHYPSQVAAISFGIVLASIMIPLREITTRTWKEFVVFLLTVFAFFIVFSQGFPRSSENPSAIIFFGGGLLASAAGFFPGISISLALLIMGLYQPLFSSLEAITSRAPTMYDFGVVVFFLVGLAIGMLACVRILTVAIAKHKSLFLAFIVGLIVASLKVVWPFRTVAIGGISHPLWPWEVQLPVFTEQLLYITIAFILVSLLRKAAENKGTLATSFGGKKRMMA